MLISHCIINQNAVVHGLERARGAYPFVKRLIDEGIAFIQLPCPEFLLQGADRKPMSYEDYQGIKGYRKACRELVLPILVQLRMYREEGYTYLGVIGIAESPNCALQNRRGVLMEVLCEALQNAGFHQKYAEVPVCYEEGKEDGIHEIMNIFFG